MTDTLTGQKIGKYTLAEKLGRGGMAEVYKAYQENLDRYVAIKLMHTFLAAEADFLHRFKREAHAMAALRHPNIVGIYDFDVWKDDMYYLVMEYINGGTLKEFLENLAKNEERMPLRRAVAISRQVADALAYAHKRNMVHRDIKPANIMLDDTGRAILTDFGIVKLLGAQSMAYTATGALIGTPSYMSPEQAMGQPGDERCDIYSLGVLLFQMTTGELPFAADTPLAVVMKHVNEPVPMPVQFNPEVPADLQSIILHALEKDPAKRIQSAEAFAEALQAIDFSGAAAVAAVPVVAETVVSTPEARPAPPPVVQETAATIVESAATPSPAPAAAAAVPPTRKRPAWLIPLLVVGLLAIVVSGVVIGLNGGGRGDENNAAAVAVADTSTPTPTAAANTPEVTTAVTPTTAPDVAATVVAVLALTEEAQPTETAVASSTPSKTPTPTVNPTLTFLQSCTYDAELVLAYPYNYITRPDIAVPTSSTFPYSWVLQNSGTCPWPEGLVWDYVSGTQFGFDGKEPLPVDTELLAGDIITLTTSLVSPSGVNAYDSVWQLVDADGEPFGPELGFQIRTYLPATSTPVPTNTPIASPTPNISDLPELNYLAELVPGTCEYQGIDWQCQFKITAYGGGGGPYTVFVFDQPAGQATEFRGGSVYYYFPKARRCAAFNSNVRVLDEATGLFFDRFLYVRPNDYFECTE